MSWTALLFEKVPFFALVAVSSFISVLAQRPGGASLGMRLSNAIVSYKAYLVATFWPSGLAIYYPFPVLPVPWVEVAASAFFLALLLFVTHRLTLVHPSLAVGWWWFVGMLVPVIGFVYFGPHARADRFTYLPQIGTFLGATWFAAGSLPASARRPRVLGPLAGGVVAACLLASTSQAGYWRSSEAILRRTLALTRDNWTIQNALGATLTESGQHAEAILHYREAIRINPDFAEARYSLGISLAALMRHDEAVTQYREAIRINPDFAEARYNLGISLAALMRHEEAIIEYREAIRVNPFFSDAHNNLGASLAALMRHKEAVVEYREAIHINPVSADAHSNLGNSLAVLGRYEDAASSFREAMRIDPDHAAARTGLSWLARHRGLP